MPTKFDLICGYSIDKVVEIVPVRYGKWIREPNCWYRCSKCGSHYPSIVDNMDYHYCPNCGAKMDEEKENGKID